MNWFRLFFRKVRGNNKACTGVIIILWLLGITITLYALYRIGLFWNDWQDIDVLTGCPRGYRPHVERGGDCLLGGTNRSAKKLGSVCMNSLGCVFQGFIISFMSGGICGIIVGVGVIIYYAMRSVVIACTECSKLAKETNAELDQLIVDKTY